MNYRYNTAHNNVFTFARVGSSAGKQPSHIPPPKPSRDSRHISP